MIKKSFSFLLLLLFVFSLSAQSGGDRKTILFLIPFYTDDYNAATATNVRNSQDISKINSFLIMGFWAGAQIALQEYEEQNAPLNIVVRDVTENEASLRKIMEDETLMREVDMIIGPFFNKSFTIAATYAKKYGIPIVNPFTKRTDILSGNKYVYKVSPSVETKPAMLSYLSETFPKSNIIIYQDSSGRNEEQIAYKQYFVDHKIPFKEVNSQKSLLGEIKEGIKNIVVVFNHNEAKMLMISRDMLYSVNPEDVMLVVPEKWLQSTTYDVDYYSKLNLHFFSPYYVDENDQQTQVFEQVYKERFHTIPTLENFAFQGYDITRFFVELALHNGDLDRVKTVPLACPMSFEKTKGGGYENINIHFLEIKEDEIVPVTF